MGEVWRAHDRLLGRDVAMKFIGERELRETPGAEAILRDEARAGGSLLGHPQIVSVLDLLEVDTALHQGPALVMEYVEGCNLAEWIVRYVPKLDEYTRQVLGLFISLEIIQAIQAAHRRDILHRDIKPLNILLSTDGRVKVADFGLARVVEAITRTHTVKARQTPLYAAPEQWREEKLDKSTDVYQLAATLYHLIAGRPANEGQGLWGLYRWHEIGKVVPLKEREPTLVPEVADVITNGLKEKGEDRPSLWSMFDPISTALMKPCRLEIDATGCTDEQVAEIVKVTDFEEEMLREPGKRFPFPNPLEAAQEAIAAVLLGGKSAISPP
ncbi:Serine/threonine protein kinase [Micromonospora chaiyaphumensis]|uniref:Serine/threonine protein kinase n=2 Tax=Micromonospora chaiyaphumensis TaxID=307119 RepID=A0A1C4ZJ86_9ACTN|nr:Serine/threonine protein kinase [Micromonospora chaiyaphumensis]